MIVKVQRPVTPPDAPLLVYDRTRTYLATLEQAGQPELLQRLGRDLKGYFAAAVIDGRLVVRQRVPAQPW